MMGDECKKLVGPKTRQNYYQFYYVTRKVTWKFSSERVLAKMGSARSKLLPT